MVENNHHSQKKDKVNPFPGLKAYKIEESHFYYSFDYRTDDVLTRLRTNKFLTLVGEPGSGKASMVNCAVIPSLQEGFAGKGGSQWNHISFRPGANPLKNLALVLANAKVFLNGGKIEMNFAGQLEEMLRENVHGLLNIFEKYTLKREHNLLIFIDDFEDIFAYKDLSENEEDALLFINLILKFIRRSNHPVYLIMAFSSDFLSESSKYPGLPEVINDSQYMIPKMDVSHLKRIMEHSFTVAGIKVDPVIITTIQQDFVEIEANNYQLQYVLKKMVDLWLQRAKSSEPLDLTYYERAGGLEQAIEEDAEKLFGSLNSKQKKICSILFKSITQKGEGDRTRAVTVEHIGEVARVSVDQVIELINLFYYDQFELIEVIESYDIEERLDSLDNLLNHPFSQVNRYSKITLRNGDLTKCWKRLKQWVEAERKFSDIYIRLAGAVSLFRQNKKGYYTNPELDMALDWYRKEQPNEAWANVYASNFNAAVEYLLASEKNYQNLLEQERLQQESKVKRDKQFKWLLIIASVLSLSLAGWAYNEKLHEVEAREALYSNHLKLGYVQNLDSIRVLYIHALQHMDSAHIDKVRYEVRRMTGSSRYNVKHVNEFTERVIRQDSLCKKGIKSEINKIKKALDTWSRRWQVIDGNSDSVKVANENVVNNFCRFLKGHCPDQEDELISIVSKCK